MANRLRTNTEQCSSDAILICCTDAPNENADPTSSIARACQRAGQEPRQPFDDERAKRRLFEPIRHPRFAATPAGGGAPPPLDRAQRRRAGTGRARSLVTGLWCIRASGRCRTARDKVLCCVSDAAAAGRSGKHPLSSQCQGPRASRLEGTSQLPF